ncbi:hypothetical protein CR513_16576, partial [Mucuna pruriens]
MEGNVCHCIRKLQLVLTGTPNIQSLRRWGEQLKGQWRRAFKRKYGNLLGLASVEVLPATLSTLTQYYDLPLKCFTFRDFQLTLTLEEYERKKSEWSGRDPRNDLGGKAPEEEDWPAFVDVYGLLVYGIMLFPQIEHYVDLVAIDAFLGRQDRGEHPIVAVLANTYYTLDYCNMRNGNKLRCCTTQLFLRLIAQLFHNSKKTRCPIKDHYWSCVKLLTKAEWTARLDEATKRSIRWYPHWNERDDVIIYCGGFPNVPLMGTKGAINCNPELTLHQARYPMVLPPSEEVVTPFILHDLGIQEGEHFKKIHQAWKKTIRKGPEWGLRSCEASSSYKSWLQHRVESIFLTFGDPRIEAEERKLVGLQRHSKRKRKELDSRGNEES